jgi:hypothetical protein
LPRPRLIWLTFDSFDLNDNTGEGNTLPISNATDFASSDDTKNPEPRVSVNDQRLADVESSSDPMFSAMLRPDAPVGTLQVRIKGARLLRPCRRPYVVCTIESSHHISDIAELEDGKRNTAPKAWRWNYEIDLYVKRAPIEYNMLTWFQRHLGSPLTPRHFYLQQL